MTKFDPPLAGSQVPEAAPPAKPTRPKTDAGPGGAGRRPRLQPPARGIFRWLRPKLPTSVGQLDVRVHTERVGPDREEVLDWLGKELLRNYVAPGELETIFKDLGVPEVADYLNNNKFPSDPKIRTGDFGEVLTGRLLRDDQWCVPVLKLRYKQRPDQPAQGADALAFRLQETPPVVAVPEAKTRAVRDYKVEREASTSLDRSVKDLPQSLAFIVARLNGEGKKGLAVRVAELLLSPYKIQRGIVIVHDDESWTDKITDRLANVVSDATRLTVVRVRGLSGLIEDAYRTAAGRPKAHSAGKVAKSA